MLDLVNRLSSLVSEHLETTHTSRATSNVIALNPRLTALTGFNYSQLFNVMKLTPVASTGGDEVCAFLITPAQRWLLNLLTNTTHLLYNIRQILKKVIGGDIRERW